MEEQLRTLMLFQQFLQSNEANNATNVHRAPTQFGPNSQISRQSSSVTGPSSSSTAMLELSSMLQAPTLPTVNHISLPRHSGSDSVAAAPIPGPSSSTFDLSNLVSSSSFPTINLETGFVSNNISHSPGYVLAPSVPDRHQRLETRTSRLFHRPSSRRRRSAVQDLTPEIRSEAKTFLQKIVLLPDYNPTKRPPAAEERELPSRGLGLKEISFSVEDDVPTVTRKIYQAFRPMLDTITGGIQMYSSLAGHTLKIRPMAEPVLNGSELKRTGKVFIARLLDDVDFPNVIRLSGVNIKCSQCLNHFDLNLIRKHREICSTEEPELTDLENEWLDSDDDFEDPTAVLLDHNKKVMIFTDIEAYENGEYANKIKVTRSSFWDDSLQASRDPAFIAKIGCPLIVEFLGENGIDRGGLRKELLNLLLDMFAEGFTAQQDLMENGSYDASNDETSRYVAEERLYAYGLFSAIALVQETITKPFVYDNFQKFRRDSTHPFIKGLETLNVSRLLRNKRCLKNIFISCETITLAQMVTCLDKQLSEDPDQAAKEMITFGHFVKFLQQVAEGVVKYKREKVMALNDVYSFVTGSRILPLCRENRKITVHFSNVTAGEKPLLPTSATCLNTLTLSVCETADEMKALWLTIFENDGSFQFSNC